MRVASRPSRTCQFHLLSFEGPDGYSRAGGIASRVTGLAHALADKGFDTHLWFIGDPSLPGHERIGRLTLHRWCQWISAHHPGGVYDGEEGKRADYASSLPPFLLRDVLLPQLAQSDRPAAILAEEWQTVDAVLHLDWLLRGAAARHRVAMLWNANNTFGFDRIDWQRLAASATLTTVSRYMRYRMWNAGVDPLVIPNGLPPEAFGPPPEGAAQEFRRLLDGRVVLTKVARWDPDKRWLLAVDTIGALRHAGARPLLIARGGVEAHRYEVQARAAANDLTIAERPLSQPGAEGLLQALGDVRDADIIVLTAPLGREACQLLFGASSAVLANSGHEPFGLVGLETMATGGLACIGGTGEDYAVPGWNALVLQSLDPNEFVSQFRWLQLYPRAERALRLNGLATAQRFAWKEVVERNVLPALAISRGATGPSSNHWLRAGARSAPRTSKTDERAVSRRRGPSATNLVGAH